MGSGFFGGGLCVLVLFCFVFYFLCVTVITTHLLHFVMCRRPFDLGILQASFILDIV